MRRDLGRSGGAMGGDDQNTQVGGLATDPAAEDHFEWPPKDPEETLGGIIDSTTAATPAVPASGTVTSGDQTRLPNAAVVERILDRQNPATLKGLQQYRAERPIVEPTPQTHARGSTALVVQESPNRPLVPIAAPQRFGVAAVLRSRVILLAFVGVALIAVAEGAFILWTMRPVGGSETALQGVPRDDTPKRTARPPQRSAVDRATDDRAVVGSAVGTSNRSKGRALSPKTGRLVIHSEPSGAEVSIDGRMYGVTPVTRENVSPGEHAVVLKHNGSEMRQTVRVEPGSTFSMVASMKASVPASGWIAIKSPVEVSVFEDGALLGTSLNPKIMLKEGAHTLELINEELGYREQQSVRVEPERISSVGVTLPQSTINFNARPWAEVWIDGKSVGETPIGSLPITIGPHEVTFRHPELGEKSVSIVVKAGVSPRVTADLTRLIVNVR